MNGEADLEAVNGVRELVLDPLEAVGEGGLELAFHGEGVIRGDPALALLLWVGRLARPVEAVGVGTVLIPELASSGRRGGGVVSGGGLWERPALLH